MYFWHILNGSFFLDLTWFSCVSLKLGLPYTKISSNWIYPFPSRPFVLEHSQRIPWNCFFSHYSTTARSAPWLAGGRQQRRLDSMDKYPANCVYILEYFVYTNIFIDIYIYTHRHTQRIDIWIQMISISLWNGLWNSHQFCRFAPFFLLRSAPAIEVCWDAFIKQPWPTWSDVCCGVIHREQHDETQGLACLRYRTYFF